MENLGTHFGLAATVGLVLRALAASPIGGELISKARPGILNAISLVLAVLSAVAIEVSFEGSFETGGTLAVAWPGIWAVIDKLGGVLASVGFQQQALWGEAFLGRKVIAQK